MDRTGTTVCQHGTATDMHCILCCGKFEECSQCEAIFKKTEKETLDFVLAKRRKEMNSVPLGAIYYQIIKLSKHKPEEQTNVPRGFVGEGYVRVLTQAAVDHCKIFDNCDNYVGKYYECQLKAKPRINSPLILRGGPQSLLYTSRVESYYVHEDADGYVEHPDKLVLPKEMLAKLSKGLVFKFPEMVPGDMIICTLNSMYHLREIPGKEYQKELPIKQIA